MNKPPRIMIIFGTRPEAIKMVPIIRAFRAAGGVELRLAVTAQHREMLDQVLDTFGIAPDIDLNLMRQNQSLAKLTARILETLDSAYERENPDLVLVQGDTSTTFCASLAAFYRHIPVGHVEAGLRTYDYDAPWPEEANRVLTTHLADLHFAPTERSRANLVAEHVDPDTIFVTGNTAIDTLLLAREMLSSKPVEVPGLPQGLFGKCRVILVTGHRRESFGDGFRSICGAIDRLADRYRDVQFVYPVHMNPNVRCAVMKYLGNGRRSNVHLIEPLSYLSFVQLMQSSYLILTDSGGVQEEAPSLGRPVLVMRDTTERPEAVAAGSCLLAGTDEERIVTEVSRALDDRTHYLSMAQARNPFGDGNAAGRIRRACLDFLSAH